MNRKFNLRKLALLSNKNWMYLHFKKIHLSQLYHELNYSFLFHWQYFFVVRKEKEIKTLMEDHTRPKRKPQTHTLACKFVFSLQISDFSLPHGNTKNFTFPPVKLFLGFPKSGKYFGHLMSFLPIMQCISSFGKNSPLLTFKICNYSRVQ